MHVAQPFQLVTNCNSISAPWYQTPTVFEDLFITFGDDSRDYKIVNVVVHYADCSLMTFLVEENLLYYLLLDAARFFRSWFEIELSFL